MRLLYASSVALLANSLAVAATPPLLDGLPIREVTIFKDGHALVEHSGPVKPSEGKVTLRGLPAPLLGTFWSWSETANAPLSSARAASRDGLGEARPATNGLELLLANAGKEVQIELYGPGAPGTARGPGDVYSGVVTRFLPPESGQVVLQVEDQLRTFNGDDIRSIRLPGDASREYAAEAKENFLELQFAGEGEVAAGVSYVQKGLRWIPSYRVQLSDDKTAEVELQATIVNDLADLEDVSARLVIGVPNFAMEGEVDPMSLQETVQTVTRPPLPGNRARNYSNAIMSQTMSMGDEAAPADNVALPEGTKEEDLFIYEVDDLTIRKGERLVRTLGRFPVDAEQLHVLSIPLAPPSAVPLTTSYRQPGTPSTPDRPVARTTLRLTNTSTVPFTTAPALVYKGEQLLAQSFVRYTPVGGKADLELNAAVDILVRRKDEEVTRTPNATSLNGTEYWRIDVASELVLTNRKSTPVRLEIRREVIGTSPFADEPGTARMVGNDWDLESKDFRALHQTWDVPWWWTRLNGLAVYEWQIEMKSGEEATLPHRWSYFWQ
jgi:hypothetical protein